MIILAVRVSRIEHEQSIMESSPDDQEESSGAAADELRSESKVIEGLRLLQ